MKKLLIILSLSLILMPSFAKQLDLTDEYSTRYTLYYASDYKPNSYCDVGMYLLYKDKYQDVNEPIKVMINDFVSGACRIKAKPSYRVYDMPRAQIRAEDCGCGTISGSSTNGFAEVTIHDDLCQSKIKSKVSIREFFANGEVRLFSLEKRES